MKEELTLLDYWRTLWKYRFMIAALFAVCVLGAMFHSMSKPATYRASASILPASVTSGSSTSTYNMMMTYGLMSNSDIFISLLNSRTLRDEVSKELEIRQRSSQPTPSDSPPGERFTVPEPRAELTKENVISISIVDTDPKRASEIANLYVENLDRLYTGFNMKEAGDKRKFIEQRLTEAGNSLKEAENSLEAYTSSHKIGGARFAGGLSSSGLDTQLVAKKLELESKLQYTTSSNPEVIRLKREIAEMEKAISGIPGVENDLARLTRELKIREGVYQMLTEQYEQAKIEEVRNLPTVQVLDWAVPPRQKEGPNVTRSMVLAGFLSLFLGCFIAFLADYVKMQRLSREPGKA